MNKELYSKDTIMRVMKRIEDCNPMINPKEMIKEVDVRLNLTPSDYIPEEIETKTDAGDTFIRDMMDYHERKARDLIDANSSNGAIEYHVNQYIKLYKLLEE